LQVLREARRRLDEPPPARASVPDWIALYLEEDLGPGGVDGDATSSVLFPDGNGRARIVARERAFFCGAEAAGDVFGRLGVRVVEAKRDGWVEAGAVVMRVEGPTKSILAGERLALNLVARMSGIASATRELSELLARGSCGAIVAGTRKTTPGFRVFEKQAIQAGGGDPHRFGLHDAAMVKDNHRDAGASDVAAAVRKIRAERPGLPIVCEVEALEDALAAAGAGADWLLIDNQAPATAKAWAAAVWKEHPKVRIEVSGGIRPENILEYGWADRISMGWLTQKAPAKDFSLEWDA
jgi:nicotinate-nucleotide pyrophosphorylase (carboxylating)